MAEAAAADIEADLNNLTMSEEVEPLLAGVKKFISEDIEPQTEEVILPMLSLIFTLM